MNVTLSSGDSYGTYKKNIDGGCDACDGCIFPKLWKNLWQFERRNGHVQQSFRGHELRRGR